jgi:hypothetical protein
MFSELLNKNDPSGLGMFSRIGRESGKKLVELKDKFNVFTGESKITADFNRNHLL